MNGQRILISFAFEVDSSGDVLESMPLSEAKGLLFSRNLGFNLGLSLQRHKARTKVRVPKKPFNLIALML
jgi:hypothetical protein